jgi:hypothetical protein
MAAYDFAFGADDVAPMSSVNHVTVAQPIAVKGLVATMGKKRCSTLASN